MTASALGLLMGGAYAGDNNSSHIVQDGSANSASIGQSGSNNTAGDISTQRITRQIGDNNALTINQSGNGGKIGTSGNYLQLNFGVDQLGDFNKLTITQTGAGSVNTIQQVSTGAGAAPSATVNEATITQNNGNGSTLVSRVDQTYTGNGTTDAKNLVTIDQNVTGTGPRVGGGGSTGDQSGGVFQTGFANTIDIDQTGRYDRTNEVRQNGSQNSFTVEQIYSNAGGGFSGNDFNLGQQTGVGNTAVVEHLGANNLTATVSQDNSGGGTVGNDATVIIQGDSNGRAGLSGFAAATGATSSSVLQTGDGNVTDYLAVGDDNEYGVTQIGIGNEAENLSVTGDLNNLGIFQSGNLNRVDLGAIMGNRNDVGLRQLGNDNLASVDITDADDSDDNDVSITQDSFFGGIFDEENTATVGIAGDRNAVTINQVLGNAATVTIDGDDNDVTATQTDEAVATVTFAGNNNYVGIIQNDSSTATITITGDDNNRAAGFTGVAQTLASLPSNVFGPGMPVGTVQQNGQLNVATLTVGDLGASDGNLFAVEQRGNGNSIDGSIDGVGGNQAVVKQFGNTNVASFAQIGAGNIVAISQ